MRSGKHKPEGRPYQGQWKTIRRRVLTRDQHQCQIGLPGCTIDATTVDHITPIALGGEWYDEHNLRAACFHCNSTLGGLTKKTSGASPSASGWEEKITRSIPPPVASEVSSNSESM